MSRKFPFNRSVRLSKEDLEITQTLDISISELFRYFLHSYAEFRKNEQSHFEKLFAELIKKEKPVNNGFEINRSQAQQDNRQPFEKSKGDIAQ